MTVRSSFVAASSLAAIVLALSGCTVGGPNPTRDTGPPGTDTNGHHMGVCTTMTDADADGLFDDYEGAPSVDTDSDGMPDYMDTDSDNDGISDVEEAGAMGGCASNNTDGDDFPDHRDNDADNDGLGDREEVERTFTDPHDADTDDDGFDDAAEWATPGADPRDPTRGLAEDDFYIVLPYGGAPETRQLHFNTRIQQADVFFMLDRTGSMTEEAAQLRSGLAAIIPEMTMRIPDIGVGFGGFAGFGGPAAGTCTGAGMFEICPDGPTGDTPFHLYSTITNDMAQMLTDVAMLRADQGGANWASHNEALYQAATGAGILPWVGMQRCPAFPDDISPRYGYPCFRPGSLPIIVVMTDTSSKNGPDTGGVAGGTYNPAGFTMGPPPHVYEETAIELNRIGARVVGVLSIGSGCGPVISNPTCTEQFDTYARDTGTVRADGSPILLTVGCDGSGLGDRLVEAIQYLATETPMDISTRVRDGEDINSAGPVDVNDMINSIRPVDVVSTVSGATTSCPDAVRCPDDRFLQVTPGDVVTFDVQFQNDTVMPRSTSQIFRATIFVVGNGAADLDAREVVIIVPAGSVVILE